MTAKPLFFAATLTLASGCVSDASRVTNAEHPGPQIGNAIGAVGGSVVGESAGLVVGVGEGATAAVGSTFDNSHRVVRHWRMETTPDGRQIQVPEDYLVDKNGRVIRKLK